MGGYRSAAVIGAGVGGLAAAIALTRAGFEVTVYEAAPELRPSGSGRRCSAAVAPSGCGWGCG
ncbi:MAG: NAD(P)-binding protein [Thermoleophilia bacterium]|nr:NAD(P)-binding protein [Thermoleophilia bacterium]